MSEATAGVFCHAAVQNIFGKTGGSVLMLLMTACGNFAFTWIFLLADFLVDYYEIFNINNSSNFDMKNYSSLVDVKLLLKRILDGY